MGSGPGQRVPRGAADTGFANSGTGGCTTLCSTWACTTHRVAAVGAMRERERNCMRVSFLADDVSSSRHLRFLTLQLTCDCIGLYSATTQASVGAMYANLA